MFNICNVFCEFISKNKRINGGKELLEDMIKNYFHLFFENLTIANLSNNSSLICTSATVIVSLLDLYLNKEAQVVDFVDLSKVNFFILH